VGLPFLSPRAAQSRDLNPKEMTMNKFLAIVFASLLALGATSLAQAVGTAPAAPQAQAAPAAAPAAKQSRAAQKGTHKRSKSRRKTAKATPPASRTK